MINKLSRTEYQQFIEDFYNGEFPLDLTVADAFARRFTFGSDTPGIGYGGDDQTTLDYIEEHYVVPDDLELAA